MTTATPEWFTKWFHADIGLGRTARESYASMLSHLKVAPESVRLGELDTSLYVTIPRAQYEALMEAANKIVSRADGVVRSDAAGNRFRTVFADDLSELQAALRSAGINTAGE